MHAFRVRGGNSSDGKDAPVTNEGAIVWFLNIIMASLPQVRLSYCNRRPRYGFSVVPFLVKWQIKRAANELHVCNNEILHNTRG